MTIPAIIFGVAFAALLGAGFHFWRSGDKQQLLIFLGAAQVGFWGGHFAAAFLGWTFASIGPLQAGTGVIGAVILLALAEVARHIEFPAAESEEDV